VIQNRKHRVSLVGLKYLAPVAMLMTLAACGSSSGSNGDASGDGQVIEAKLSDAGCEPNAMTATAGPVTFKVTNDGAGGVTEFEVLKNGKIVGEVENVAPGFEKEFDMTLSAGSYTTLCPGGDKEKGTLEVTAG
jgi:iron uptake system component EfeO